MCIEEAPSLWPPGTVCQRGTWGWAQSNASSWHCAYDTSNNLNYVQQTFMHVFSSCMCSCLIYVHICFPERRVLPLLWCNASCCLSVVFRFNCTHNKLFFLFGVWIFHLLSGLGFYNTGYLLVGMKKPVMDDVPFFSNCCFLWKCTQPYIAICWLADIITLTG